MKFRFLFIFYFFSQTVVGQDSVEVTSYRIGTDTLQLHNTIYYPDNDSISFINLHDDENTSVEAGLLFISKYGGSLLQLQHSGKRYFNFKLKGQSFSFDPNRIFTKSGIKATLSKQNIYREDAAREVKIFSDSLLKNIANKKLVIALHNNTEKGLSILSYKKNGTEAKNTGRLYINKLMSKHDFILTTQYSIFNYLKRRKINVVLQHHNPVDDGSLSVYAAKKRIAYINIEALHGHLDEQIRMLEAIKNLIYRNYVQRF